MVAGFEVGVLAAVVSGVWMVFHQLAAEYVNSSFGPMVVNLAGLITGMVLFVPKFGRVEYFSDWRGILFLILAGVMAFAMDITTLKAYGAGLPVSVGGPLIIGGGMVVAVLGGFLLGDVISWRKIFGVGVMVFGVCVLSR